MKITNTGKAVVTLPTGTKIDGPTEVSEQLLAHIDNRAYVGMMFTKGRLKVVKPKPKTKTQAQAESER